MGRARAGEALPGVREGDKRRALAHFARLGRGYNAAVERWPFGRQRARERAAVLAYAQLWDPAIRWVIDVGCGGGFYAWEAKRAGKRVVGVDAVPAMLAALAGRIDRVICGDLDDFQDGVYDLVICSGVLEFVSSPARAFANLANLVAPGGRLVQCRGWDG